MRVITSVFIFSGLFFIMSLSIGQTSIADRVLECGNTEGEASQECWDSLLNDFDEGTFSTANTIAKWTVRTDTDPIDDSPTVTLRNDSNQGISSFGEPITLVLRCSSGKTEVYIDWKDYLGSDRVSVTSRVGTNNAGTTLWGLSTDHKATFYPGFEDTFISRLMNTDTFAARATPYNESPVTAVWDLAGLSEAVTPLREACGW